MENGYDLMSFIDHRRNISIPRYYFQAKSLLYDLIWNFYLMCYREQSRFILVTNLNVTF